MDLNVDERRAQTVSKLVGRTWDLYSRLIILQFQEEGDFVKRFFQSWIYFQYYVPRPKGRTE